MEQNPLSQTSVFTVAARLISIVLIILIMYCLQGVLVPLLFSMLIAITLYPLARRMEMWKFPRLLSSIIAVIIGIIVIAGLIYLIVNQALNIGKNGDDMADKLQGILTVILNWANTKLGVTDVMISQKFHEFTDNALSNATTYLQTAFSSIGGILSSVVLVPLFVFFMLYYRDFFREFFLISFKSTGKERVHTILNNIYSVVQNYLVGLITVMGIVAILNTIGLLVMGIGYAWFFGILAALLMLIPYIGIAIGSILPALFAIATKDNAWYSIGVIVWFQVVQFLEANLITPNIVGSKVSINPLMSIVGLLLGGMLFGLAGLILALPLIAITKVILDSIPSLSHFGFLIGEPDKIHLKPQASFINIKRKQTKAPKIEKKQGNIPPKE
ncbi:AI-2E family transporter [Albibacterium bauzanense]|uniref:Putative PurR-regulated permease PerM n=1 Tax=Albibacterium bauzanense TaxID=653929 RepID=A0A4R1LQF1_9SPHI|nr:AI-2E family transporter [Albibacterium bauzanense]TCK80687.1 putative PurR-regulated permease PerM [Albibacterium bauzanense]